MSEKNATLIFHPKITITAEHVASVLGVSIEKANQLLSRPDTDNLLKQAMHDAVQGALLSVLQNMARIPHETVPVRVDCSVELPSLPPVRGMASL